MGDYLLPFQPSLAQATNTRLDSACKHIQQCRVSTDDMMRFTGEDAVSILFIICLFFRFYIFLKMSWVVQEELQRNKYRYCIHKDELVVGIGRPWYVTFMLDISYLPFLLTCMAGILLRWSNEPRIVLTLKW